MNSVHLTGRLGTSPELRHTRTGKAVCDMRVAIDERRDTEREPVWITVQCWEALAETTARFLAKGRRVAVTGRVALDRWQADDGSNRERLYVVATEIDFLDQRRADPKPEPAPAAADATAT